MKRKSIIVLAILIMVLTAWHMVMTDGSYTYTPVDLPETFDEYYKEKLRLSKELNVRPGNEEKLIRYKNKTDIAILYIHGYSASRAEGEYVIDRIAETFKANTYYLRLPGHGTNVEDHAAAEGKEHLDEVLTALKMMQLLGDKIIVTGTSMGGVIGTYLAAEYPELVDALILSAPAYQFAQIMPKAASFYPLFKVITTFMERAPEKIVPEGHDWGLYWYTNQYLKALRQLYQLQAIAAHEEIFREVKQPVLLQYYYKDKNNQDTAASVAHMREAYKAFNNGTPHKLSREKAFTKGGHILLSKYAIPLPDFDDVEKETRDFIISLGW